MATKTAKIKPGDKVMWKNLYAGNVIVHEGRVAAVVPPGSTALAALRSAPIQKLVKGLDTGRLDPYALTVGEESYVVNVDGVAFWPKRVTGFQKVSRSA